MSEQDKKKEALSLAMSAIEKQFGKGSIMMMGENKKLEVSVIPSGILTIDHALGVGGVPRGRIIEIYGPESSGKTTVALKIAAQAQAQGGIAAFVDAEHALDPAYAKVLGVDVDSLLISQPDSGEQALEIAEMLIRSGAIDVLVVDSVAALVPRNELDGEMGEMTVGLQARLMSQALRKLTAVIGRSGTVCIFINQLREKIGVMYGNPETTTGGRALKFYSSVRMEVRRGEALKVGSELYGHRTKVKIVKNKVAPPFRDAEFDMLLGKGPSAEGVLVDLGVQFDIVQKSGAWFGYNSIRIGQGRDNARNYLVENPHIAREIENKIREKMGLSALPEIAAPGEAAAATTTE